LENYLTEVRKKEGKGERNKEMEKKLRMFVAQ
jgi:hypothetical protein